MSPRLSLVVLLLPLLCAVAGADPVAPDSVMTTAGTNPVALHHYWVEGIGRPDRVAHASLALALGVGVGLASREPAAGAGTALTLAVAKELLDDRFDRGDLAAGALGAGLAWLVVATLKR